MKWEDQGKTCLYGAGLSGKEADRAWVKTVVCRLGAQPKASYQNRNKSQKGWQDWVSVDACFKSLCVKWKMRKETMDGEVRLAQVWMCKVKGSQWQSWGVRKIRDTQDSIGLHGITPRVWQGFSGVFLTSCEGVRRPWPPTWLGPLNSKILKSTRRSAWRTRALNTFLRAVL